MKFRAFGALVLLLPVVASAPLNADPFLLVSETTWGGPGSDIAESVAGGADGSVYVAGRTGSFASDFNLNVFVLKFAADGSLVWQRTWDIPGGFGDQLVHDLAVGPDGSVYVAGRTDGVGGDALVLKFDPNGTLVWQKTWSGAAHESAEGVAVANDNQSVYLAGGTNSFGANDNAFIVKLAVADGSAIWQKTYGTAGGDTGWDIAVDGGGNLLLTGGTEVAGTSGLYLAKLTDLGDILWQRSYVARRSVSPRGGLAVGPDGSAVVAALVLDAAFGMDAAVIKFNPNGNLVWDRVWGDASGDEPEGVAIGADGTVFLAGSTSAGTGGTARNDAFLVKFLANGRAREANTWGGAGLERGHDVAVAPDGHIMIAGTAEAPPYQFLMASAQALRLRGTVGVPTLVMTDVTATLADAGGVASTPNGSLTYAGGFDAALLKIAP